MLKLKKLVEQTPFDTPSQLFPPANAPAGSEFGGATLKNKKTIAEIVSTLNFAIGKLGKRELRVGKKITGLNELIRLVKVAYNYPPKQQMPTSFNRANLQLWINGHDPTVDGIPLEFEKGTSQITIIDATRIKQLTKDKEAAAKAAGLTAP